MLNYLLKRLGMTILVVLLAMVFLASLSHIIPGDPVKLILGPRASAEMAERVRDEMGLNKAIPVQIIEFVVHTLQGDLGRDFVTGAPVTRLIRSALPHTILLALLSLGMAVLIGIPIGVISKKTD